MNDFLPASAVFSSGLSTYDRNNQSVMNSLSGFHLSSHAQCSCREIMTILWYIPGYNSTWWVHVLGSAL